MEVIQERKGLGQGVREVERGYDFEPEVLAFCCEH